MEAPHTQPPEAGPPNAPAGELVDQNGRLVGARRSLKNSVTLIGQADSCDVRLAFDGVSPRHCVLAQGTEGLLVRDLDSETGTWVNGVAVTSAVLRTGDVLAVGPCRFRIRLDDVGPFSAAGTRGDGPGRDALEKEKEALRIQAAAVAAQQAALMDEEAKFRQRLVAMAQQEAQLAGHLEEKRRRLLEYQEQARQAREAMRNERVAYEKRIAAMLRELAVARDEVCDGQRLVAAERRRLLRLRARMKKRWHRHWLAERRQMDRRDADLTARGRQLERERQVVGSQRNEVARARLAVQAEAEVARRHFQEAEQEFHQARRRAEQSQATREKELQAQLENLYSREAAVATAEAEAAERIQRLEDARPRLEREVAGLETRITQARRLLEQQIPAGRAALPGTPPSAGANAVGGLPEDNSSAVNLPVADWEALARSLEDQRLGLLAQGQRFAVAVEALQADRDRALNELEQAAWQVREQELAVREQEDSLRRHGDDLDRRDRALEGWQSQLTLRTSTWEAQKDTWLGELQGRENCLEEQLGLLEEYRRRWGQRARRGLDRFREMWAELDQLRRRLSAPATPSAPPSVGEFFETITMDVAAGGNARAETSAGWDERFEHLRQQAEALCRREIELVERETTFERGQLRSRRERVAEEAELRRLAHRQALADREVTELKEEIERLARQLIGEAGSATPPMGRAA